MLSDHYGNIGLSETVCPLHHPMRDRTAYNQVLHKSSEVYLPKTTSSGGVHVCDPHADGGR